MLKKNEDYIVDIIDNGYQGEGIAKIDGMTIFIDNAIKGEKVKIKILKVLKTKAYGKIVEIIKVSPNRCKKTDCATFPKCGGCNLRHIEYEKTLEIKKTIVENNIKKIGIENVKVNDCIGMKNPFFYRNKLQYPVGIVDNKPTIGVFAKRSHRIIETKNCLIQNKKIQEVANDIFDFIVKNNIPVYNEEDQTGQIRHIYIRIGIKTQEVMVILVTNKRKITKEKELVEYITSKYSEIKTVVKNINSKFTNVILGNENIVLYGNGYIEDNLLGNRFKISPMSFYQVNPIQTEKLYSEAIKGANLKGDETIFDLYCGIGTIGICASKHVKKVYGIETVPQAIEDAKENVKINKLNNLEFITGNVEEELPKLVDEINIKPDLVFIDPPRKGCDNKTIETLLKVEPKKIIYISCNPATLTRDLKQLEEKYQIKEITPVDMFPFTSHIESIAILNLKETLI